MSLNLMHRKSKILASLSWFSLAIATVFYFADLRHPSFFALVGYGVIRGTLPNPSVSEYSRSKGAIVYLSLLAIFVAMMEKGMEVQLVDALFSLRHSGWMIAGIVGLAIWRIVSDLSYLKSVPVSDVESFYAIRLKASEVAGNRE